MRSEVEKQAAFRKINSLLLERVDVLPEVLPADTSKWSFLHDPELRRMVYFNLKAADDYLESPDDFNLYVATPIATEIIAVGGLHDILERGLHQCILILRGVEDINEQMANNLQYYYNRLQKDYGSDTEEVKKAFVRAMNYAEDERGYVNESGTKTISLIARNLGLSEDIFNGLLETNSPEEFINLVKDPVLRSTTLSGASSVPDAAALAVASSARLTSLLRGPGCDDSGRE